MSDEQSSHSIKFLEKTPAILSGIGLLADILAIGKLAYDVIIERQLSDLGFKLVVLVVIFLFGIGLGYVSIKGLKNASLLVLIKFYAWIYIAIACLSYFGIVLTLHKQDYTFGTYSAFVLVILVDMLAVGALHVVIEKHNIRYFSVPVLTVCLFHSIFILYTYVFAAVPVSFYLAGDLFFFTAMTLVGSIMYGDIGFKTVFLRLAGLKQNKKKLKQVRSKMPK